MKEISLEPIHMNRSSPNTMSSSENNHTDNTDASSDGTPNRASFLPRMVAGPNVGSSEDVYKIGIGIADITGPAAEVNMMGYAKFGQDTQGIHFRQFARTFAVEDRRGSRVLYISCDLGMIDQAVKTAVATTLNEKYDGMYSYHNILITGTHTHSGPGGFLQYLLYTIVSQGFTKQTFDAIVDGIILSVDRAHSRTRDGHIYWSQSQLLDASINRSPTAYLNNSEEERSKYEHNTDKDVYQLTFTDLDGKTLGLINWFAVHPTSMNNTNTLISGDNKGYASLLLESAVNGKDRLLGKGPFVAAFSNANLGDVSPNLKGPKCMDTGEPCDGTTSTCGGKSEMCIAVGPGVDMFESTAIIAERQAKVSKLLLEKVTQTTNGMKDRASDGISFSDDTTSHLIEKPELVSGPVSFVHQHIDMSNVTINRPDGTSVRTCRPAMGYSFAAGTVDGPGAFDFKQGSTSGNRFWNLVRDFISKPSKSMIECHAPKPILLSTGQMNTPYPWQPTILPTQVIRIGNVIIVALPAEFTTMSGRRMKETVRNAALEQLRKQGNEGQNVHVVISGLANAYSSYVSTFEEYQVQRYEGASTIFGPHTLEAYLQQYSTLTHALIANQHPPSGPEPPNLLTRQISLRPGVVFDSPPFKKSFGDVLIEPEDLYKVGSLVTVTFVAGHPRNDLMSEKTFLTVERRVNGISGLNVSNGNNESNEVPRDEIDIETDHDWKVIATDTNLETRFIWKRSNYITGTSSATVVWNIPPGTEPGLYRIRHFGAHKTLLQSIVPYQGTTKVFKVVPEDF